MLEFGVPADATTCHVAEVDGYVVAGHVPVEAITSLLAERPSGVGVVVPGMPTNSPGMGGDHDDWIDVEVLFIGDDGELSVFDF